MQIFPAILVFFAFFVGIAGASAEETVGPSGSGANYIAGSSSAQDAINIALSSVYEAGGGTVYLESGVYTIDGQIRLGSNTKLTGSPDAIIKVSSSSSQWFTDGVGVIGAINEPLENVEITGFQIDGNCENLPTGYENSGKGDHNAERLIDFRASTEAFSNNISIHKMRLYDSYSDGFHIAFAKNVNFYNNICSDNQHDSCFYVDVLGGSVFNNKIEGITDDCMRLDNCRYIKVHNNYFTSYSGSNNHGNFEYGANGLQLGDEGFSHGGGSTKPDYTNDIEIFNNLFNEIGLAGIQLDSKGQSETENVLIHHNSFVNCGLESNAQWGSGISIGPWGSGIDIENNTFNSCFQDSIQVLSSLGPATAIIKNNNIVNTKGKGQSIKGGLSSEDLGYGIFKAENEMSLTVTGNYFSRNLKADSNVPCLDNSPSVVIGAGGNGNSIIGNFPTPNINQKGATVPERITSIFDFLKKNFDEPVHQRVSSILVANITEVNEGVNYSLISVPYTGLQKVEYKYGALSSTYTPGSSWQGNIPHQGENLFIEGNVDQSQLKIVGYTNTTYFDIKNFNVVKKEFSGNIFQPWVFVFLGFFGLLLLYCIFVFKRIFLRL